MKTTTTAVPKKLSIQLKTKPALPDNYFASTWGSLAQALAAVRHHEQTNELGFSELYGLVENLCLHKFGPQTYVALYRDVDHHLALALQREWDQSKLLPGPQFLHSFAAFWRDYCEVLRATRLIFTVLDRNPKLLLMQDHVPGAKSIWDMGLLLFKTHLVGNAECLDKLVLSLLQGIAKERREGALDTTDSNSGDQQVLRMFFNLNLYSSNFEPRFLSETHDFYRQEALELISNGETTVADYLVKAERRLGEESRRGQAFVDPSTRRPLKKICEDALVTNHAPVLVERGLDQFLQEHRLEQVHRMYVLFELVGLHDTLLVNAFALNCKARGMALVMGEERTTELVSKLLELKNRLDELCDKSFDHHPAFARAVRQSFEAFLNAGEDNKPAELIAKFIDRTLRSHMTSHAELELQLTSSMTLFRYLHAKDVFEEFYKQCLAKRLLLGTSNSPDLEQTMIANLKSECGSSFTSKLEGMMRDIDQSKSTSQQFQSRMQMLDSGSGSGGGGGGAKLESAVQVLSMGFWPSFPDSPCALPRVLEEEKDRFTKFYSGKHEGRVLHWVNSLGRCTLMFQLEGKGKWDLDVSLFQAAVLLEFNTHNSVTFKQLAESTLISSEELVKTLSSLALGKRDQRVLVRSTKGSQSIFAATTTTTTTADKKDADEEGEEDVEEEEASLTSKLCHLDDVFQVNPNWTSKRSRLKINQIQIKETKKENDDAHKRVQGDRQYQIDATIVRIMKSRKQLTHSLLVTELFKQLPFPAKPQDLKKRIESLIDREYLERDEADANVYVYVA